MFCYALLYGGEIFNGNATAFSIYEHILLVCIHSPESDIIYLSMKKCTTVRHIFILISHLYKGRLISCVVHQTFVIIYVLAVAIKQLRLCLWISITIL